MRKGINVVFDEKVSNENGIDEKVSTTCQHFDMSSKRYQTSMEFPLYSVSEKVSMSFLTPISSNFEHHRCAVNASLQTYSGPGRFGSKRPALSRRTRVDRAERWARTRVGRRAEPCHWGRVLQIKIGYEPGVGLLGVSGKASAGKRSEREEERITALGESLPIGRIRNLETHISQLLFLVSSKWS